MKVAYRNYSRGARGWGNKKPRRVSERQAVMDKCGADCFMRPEYMGFPVCQKLNTSGQCTVDCRGLLAAKVRGAQWKYPDVVKKADARARSLRCRWTRRQSQRR